MNLRHSILVLTITGWVASLNAAPLQDPAASVAQLIDGLSGESYRQRESSMHDLTERGLHVIPDLIQALQDADPETRWRIAKAVEDIGLSGDERSMRKVTRIMYLLGSTGMPGLIEKSARMRDLWLDSQVQQVCDQLSKLGATVSVSTQFEMAMEGIPLELMGVLPVEDSSEQTDAANPIVAPEEPSDSMEPSADAAEIIAQVAQILAASDTEDVRAISDITIRVQSTATESGRMPDGIGAVWADSAIPQQYLSRVVTIDSQWSGSPDDWQLLAKVSRLSRVNLSSVELAGHDWQALAKIASLRTLFVHQCVYESADAFAFQRRRPDVYVQIIGRGFLGVMGPPGRSEEPCVLSDVRPGTGAEQAGLKKDDLILAIDGNAVKTFADLVFLVGSRNAGDEIEIEYQRDGQIQTTSAVLQPREPEFQ